MLADVESISKIDKSGMLDVIEKFPEQIKDSIDRINSYDINSLYKVDNIIICGMGGSAISGDIIQFLLKNTFNIPIYVNREYSIPKWANKDTLVISQSYSGNTEETLSSFKNAFQKKCKLVGISSGGKLKEYCNNRQVQHIEIPSGFAPRAATAYMLFTPIYYLVKCGLLKSNINADVEEALEVVEIISENNNKNIPDENNLAKQIASKIFGTIPQIYGWDIYSPIAKRWSNQFNENSKIVSGYDIVPECNHNDIVGWSQNLDKSKNFSCILFRDKKLESIYLSTRLNFMKKLFANVAGNLVEIEINAKKPLAKMMYSMYIGDFVSCYLGVLREMDPTPVDVIVELKDALSEL